MKSKFDQLYENFLYENFLTEFAKPAVGYKLTQQAQDIYAKEEENGFKDLNSRQAAVLGTIFVNPGTTRKQVADIVGKQDPPLRNPQSTGFIIKSLIDMGLVELTTAAAFASTSSEEEVLGGPSVEPSGELTDKTETTLEDIIYNAMKQIDDEVTVSDLIDIIKSTDIGKKYRDPEDVNAIRYTALKKDVEKILTQLRKDGTIGINIHTDPVKYYLKDTDSDEETEIPELEFGPEKRQRKLGWGDIEKELGYEIERPERELPWDLG